MKYHFIHERGDYPILAVEDIGSAWSSSIKKVVADADSPFFFIYKNGWARIFGLEKQYQKIVNFIWKKISRDKKYVFKTKQELIKRARIFLGFIDSIKKLNLKKLSNYGLIQLKNRYSELYSQVVPYGEPIPYFLKDKIQSIIDDYLLARKRVPINDYEILVTPIYLSFLEKEKRELYKLTKIKNKARLASSLENHVRKYQWIHFDYASTVSGQRYFEKRLKELKNRILPQWSVKQRQTKKKRLVNNYKISPLMRYLINILDEAYFLMDYKKEVLTQAHFGITEVYKELGRRLGLNIDEVRWLKWQELRQALLGEIRVTQKFIHNRKRFSVGKSARGQIRFLSQREAVKLVANIDKDQNVDKSLKEIKGTPGSRGMAQGRIRYLKSARECSKFKPGEILLVSNTTPDFMPAIRQAKAIITNEGGITSHAAIVSRELKIPCVVGTKIATQVLKTGDWVEVDADKGIVKII